MTGTRRQWLLGSVAALVTGTAALSSLPQEGVSVRDFGAVGDGRTDDTRAIRKALAAALHIRFDGSYRISDAIELRDGQVIELSPGTVIRQASPGRSAFVAVRRRNVSIRLNGGTIQGPGGWSAGWTGNQGPENFRGIRYLGCSDCEVLGPGRVVNWGNAAVDFTGGRGLRCEQVTIEGTHVHGQPLRREANFQNGLFVTNHPAFGTADDVTVRKCDFSGMAQGILREAQPLPVPAGPFLVEDCLFHDIPGQHGLYNQDGNATIRNCRFRDLALSAVKNQAADAGRILRNINAGGITAERIGNALFELAEAGGHGGGIDTVVLQGTGTQVGYLAAVRGRIRNAKITVRGENITGNAIYAAGQGMRNVAISVDAGEIGQDGVLITAEDSDLQVEARIRNANIQRRYGGAAVRVTSRSASVLLTDPMLTDTRKRTTYGLFNEVAGSTVRVRGSIQATGAGEYAVRANGAIAEFPARATLQGTNGRFLGIEKIRGAH